MATKKRLIDAETLIADYCKDCPYVVICKKKACSCGVIDWIQGAQTVDALEVPCKIGDFVWAVRNYKGHKHPQRGVVSDMYFSNDMRLQIVVKHIARGKWGETIFATDKEAYAAIEERKANG